jgi:hypothetical protein
MGYLDYPQSVFLTVFLVPDWCCVTDFRGIEVLEVLAGAQGVSYLLAL